MVSDVPPQPLITDFSRELARNFERFSIWSGITVLGIGLVASLGWFLNIEILQSLHPHWNGMKLNAAFCFILLGGASLIQGLRFSRHPLAERCPKWVFKVAILTCMGIALLTLAEHLLDFDFGIDEFLISEPVEKHHYSAGRMALSSSICFILTGLAMLWANRDAWLGKIYLHRLLAFSVILLSFMSLSSYTLGLHAIPAFGPLFKIDMAFHTATCFLLLNFAVFSFQTDRGIMITIVSETMGGQLIRQALPLALVAVPTIHWGLAKAIQSDFSDIIVSIPLFSTLLVAFFIIFLLEEGKKLAAIDTERKNLESSYKKTAQRFQAIFQQTYQFMGLLTPNGTVLEANDSALAAGALRAEDIIGKPFWELVYWNHSPELQEKLIGAIEAAAHRKEFSRFVATHPALNEGLITVDFSLKPYVDDNGDVLYLIAEGRDITEQYQADEKFRILFEHSSDAHILLDETGTIDCNDVAIKQLACASKEDLLKIHPANLSPETQPDGRPSLEKALEMDAIAYAKGFHRFEWVLKKTTGETFPAEVSLTPVTLYGKSALLTVWHDLTDRKKAEAKLVENEARFRNAMEYASIGMALVSPDGYFIRVNRALCRMLGYTESEMLSLHYQTITYPADVEADLTYVHALLSGEINHYEIEKRYFNKDRNIIWVQLNASMVRDADNKPLYFIAHILDITERKKIHKDLQHAKQAAEQSSRFKSEFLANMSHEVRTPMNGILGMTEIALQTELTTEQRHYLEIVFSSGQSLLTIINDILDFSKIEAGHLEIDPIPFRLRESIAKTILLFRQQAQKKNLELIYDVDSDIPNILWGDPNRLRQVLSNLVSNAIKFTETGEITIEIIQSSPSKTTEHDEIVLEFRVSDTGIGMSTEEQTRIFDPFVQADSSTSRRFGGTGLGLSITGQLIALMNGEIWVDSTLGEGSTFCFTIAFKQINNLVDEDFETVDMSQIQGMPVLLVDDNATNLKILHETVSKWGMFPQTASTASQALDLIREAQEAKIPFPLLLSDYGMPEIDGFMLSETIKNDPNLKDTKIIILSSLGHDGELARFREIGVEGYMEKPVNGEELLLAVRECLGSFSERAASLDLPPIFPSRTPVAKLKLLLAEDHEVNQLVARHILENAGHSVFIAPDGQAAYAAYQKAVESWEPFDLILMDIHMPVMDGFQTTAAIRLDESKSGRHTPIIAVTASAIKGDRERCLNAEMDGYVAKPFESRELLEAIREFFVCELPDFCRSSHPPLESLLKSQEAPLASSSGNTDLIDGKRLMESIGGSLELLGKVTGIFSQKYPQQLAEIEKAIQQQDSHQLEITAHALKGAIGNFTAQGAFDSAHVLERKGREHDFNDVETIYNELKTSVQNLEQALIQFSQGGTGL